MPILYFIQKRMMKCRLYLFILIYDIKGCQLENKNSFGFWGAIGAEGEALVNAVEASWVKTKVGRMNSVVVEKLGLNKWNSIQESDNPVLAFYRFK